MSRAMTMKMTWKKYKKSIKFLENYFKTTINGHDNSYYVRQADSYKIDYFGMFDELYQHMLPAVPKELIPKGYYMQMILVTYDCYSYPHKMTASIKVSSEVFGTTVIWTQEQAIQEQIRGIFSKSNDIERYYAHIAQCAEKEHIKRGTTVLEMAQNIKEQARIKEERRRKREMNDPESPAARKRKARRHLQRLGYDLRKSRKKAITSDDKGLYQIVSRGTGEVIAGEKFDLTLEEIETFYKEADFTKVEQNGYIFKSMSGFLYNQEPHLESRKKAASTALKKMGYRLEVAPYKKEYYRAQCYNVVKKKEPVMKDGCEVFCLDEIERMIAEGWLKTYKNSSDRQGKSGYF